MKKALKLFASFLIFMFVSAACICLGLALLVGSAYVASFFAKVAILGAILKIIGYVIVGLTAVLTLIVGTLSTYERVFKRREE